LCSTDARLGLWRTADDDLACGLASWRNREPEPAAEERLRDAVEAAGRHWITMSRPELSAAVREVVRAAGGPVGFEVLVAALASTSGFVEPRESGDPTQLPAAQPPQDVTLEQKRTLEQVWQAVTTLPVRQRCALLLNLRDANGAGLLWLLPMAGIASIRQIARLLEVPDEEFARLWREIPLDDAAIGQRLACSRQQVINLRVAARKRLRNRLGARESGAIFVISDR
jgi:hypothetical protein